jgi:hypothetical protein
MAAASLRRGCLLLFYIYRTAFSFWDMPAASAMTVVLLVILGTIALIKVPLSGGRMNGNPQRHQHRQAPQQRGQPNQQVERKTAHLSYRIQFLGHASRVGHDGGAAGDPRNDRVDQISIT